MQMFLDPFSSARSGSTTSMKCMEDRTEYWSTPHFIQRVLRLGHMQLAGAMGESAMHALPHTLTPALKRLSSTCYSRVLKAPDFPHIQALRWPPVMQRLHLHLMFAHALIGCLCGLRQTEVLKNRYHPFKNDKFRWICKDRCECVSAVALLNFT